MGYIKDTIVEGLTRANKALFDHIGSGIETATSLAEADQAAAAAALARAIAATNIGGTSGVTGYIGPLVSTAISKEGLEEPSFLENVEQYFDGCTPEVALKPETTYAGAVNPGQANISNFLGLWKKVGPKKRWRGHTLLWWSGLPQWMYLPSEEINGKKGTWGGTEVEYKAQILAYIKQVVEAVGQRVDSWDVLNELTNAGALRQCAFTEIFSKSLAITKTNPVMQFYAECIRVAREANPGAMFFVNEYEIETTFNYGAGQRGTVFLEFINCLIELAESNPGKYGAPDGIGMQFHTNTKRLVTAAEIQAIVPKYTEKELVVEITEFDCQIEPGDTEELQGQVYSAMIEGAKKAGIGRVTVWGVTDKRSWLDSLWETAYKLTSDTAENSSVLNLTGAEGKKILKVAASKQVQVRFKAVTAGCGFALNTTYFVVGSTANSLELAAAEGGAAIKVTAGKTLKASETEIFKWAGESSLYPRPCPFTWNGGTKPGWKSVERSRPEQPGVAEWKAATLNAAPKVKNKAGKQTAASRIQGYDTRLKGVVEADENVTAGTTILTINSGQPGEPVELSAITTGAVAVILTIATNGAVTSSKELKAGEALRLDGLSFNQS